MRIAAIAIVTTIGWRLSVLRRKFVTKPIREHPRTTRTAAGMKGIPLPISNASNIEENGRIPVTVRSIPPERMTRVIPSAIIASMMNVLTMTAKFAAERKYGALELITATIIIIIRKSVA